MSEVRLKPSLLSAAVLLVLASPFLAPVVRAQDAVNLAPIAVQGVANDRVGAPTQKAAVSDMSDDSSGVLTVSPRARASCSFLADGSSVFDAASLSSAMATG